MAPRGHATRARAAARSPGRSGDVWTRGHAQQKRQARSLPSSSAIVREREQCSMRSFGEEEIPPDLPVGQGSRHRCRARHGDGCAARLPEWYHWMIPGSDVVAVGSRPCLRSLIGRGQGYLCLERYLRCHRLRCLDADSVALLAQPIALLKACIEFDDHQDQDHDSCDDADSSRADGQSRHQTILIPFEQVGKK